MPLFQTMPSVFSSGSQSGNTYNSNYVNVWLNIWWIWNSAMCFFFLSLSFLPHFASLAMHSISPWALPGWKPVLPCPSFYSVTSCVYCLFWEFNFFFQLNWKMLINTARKKYVNPFSSLHTWSPTHEISLKVWFRANMIKGTQIF